MGSHGLFWLFFAIIYLQPRPGPPLPDGQSNYILFSWITVWNTFCKWRKIPNTFLFLSSFFMYTDALHTLAQEAILFCTHEFINVKRATRPKKYIFLYFPGL